MLVCSWQWTLSFLAHSFRECDGKRHPERTRDPNKPSFSFLTFWNVKIFKPWSFPARKKQTRWKFCGGVGWGAICEGLKETNVTRSTDLSMASGYCMSKELRNCLLFELRKLFERKLLSILNLFEKKNLGRSFPSLYERHERPMCCIAGNSQRVNGSLHSTGAGSSLCQVYSFPRVEQEPRARP